MFTSLIGVLAWWVAHHLLKLTNEKALVAVAPFAALGLTFALKFGGSLFDFVISETNNRSGVPDIDVAKREEWAGRLRSAVLKQRVRGGNSALGQMVRYGTAVDSRVRDEVDLALDAAGAPRLQIRGRTVAFSEIIGEWNASPSRLVILGEPGYGKTVAALLLVGHVNGKADAPGHAVAELFSLAEWYRWHAVHEEDPLDAWLADQLVATYPDLPRAVADGLVEAGLVLPILDGLDEVPATDRAACRAAIEAYAGRSEPLRPFVLTCRAREYQELGDWASADRQVILVGLASEQVAEVLKVPAAQWPGWAVVRDRVSAGDQNLCELFRSPLRLGIALQAYRSQDPLALVGLSLDAAKQNLWEALLGPGGTPFNGASPAEVRSWLRFLAVGMRRQNRQRFWLHELYLYAPEGDYLRRPSIQVGAGVGVISGLVALTFGLIDGLRRGLVDGLGFGLGGGLLGVQVIRVRGGRAMLSAVAGWRARVRAVKDRLLTTVMTGLAIGLALGLIVGLRGGLIDGLIGGLVIGFGGGR
jgi:hypothetical protein